jgi:Mg2+/Co2+ transporter CorB
MTVSVIIILVLVGLSAFFSSSETALTAVSRPLMHQLEQEGHQRAGLVNRMLDRKERMIGALLLGNTAVNILAGSIATSAVIVDFGEAGVAYATAALTVVVLMFGEILPKTYALHNANTMAQSIARPVRLVVTVLAPIVQVLQLILNGILRLFGAKFTSRTDVDSALAELRGAIEMHTTDEEVKRERLMLRSILDLDDVTVDEVMTHRKTVAMINADLPAAQIVDAVLESPYTRIPLWRDNHDNITGVINAKVLLRAVRAHPGDIDSLDVAALASSPWFIPDSTTLLDQLQAFRERREHFSLVVDEYGSLLGVVTLEDILEEIVGDISDEHDIAVTGVRPQPDGSFIVNGNVTLRDLNRELGWRLPDEEASTIAGLVLHESRQIPEVGQAFLFHGFRFEVLRRQRNQLTTIKVTPPAEKGEE